MELLGDECAEDLTFVVGALGGSADARGLIAAVDGTRSIAVISLEGSRT
jgi:hypothetical protein